jgi:hypothetical protein
MHHYTVSTKEMGCVQVAQTHTSVSKADRSHVGNAAIQRGEHHQHAPKVSMQLGAVRSVSTTVCAPLM